MPYVVWLDGIGWRNDKIGKDIAGMKVPWDIFWESQPWKGKVGDPRRRARRARDADAARRDAQGPIPDLNTEDPAIIAKAGDDLSQLTSISNVKVDITDYQTLPEGKSWLHHAWSGDLLGGAVLPAEGRRPDVLSFWGPGRGGVVQNDMSSARRDRRRAPCSRTRFLNFMLDEKNAYDNFVQLQRLHAAAERRSTRDALVKQRPDPEEPRGAPSCGPTSSPTNQELLALSVEGEQLWHNAWAKFKAG